MEMGHIRNSPNVQDLKRFMAHIIEHGHINKHWRQPKGQWKMDYHETLVTLGTQDTGRRQTKQENKTRSNMDHTNNQNNICPSLFSSIVVVYSHIWEKSGATCVQTNNYHDIKMKTIINFLKTYVICNIKEATNCINCDTVEI